MIKHITPKQASKKLKTENIRLIDIREEWEHQTAKIEGSELMPMSTFGSYIPQLDKNEPLLIYCHHGVRSYNVCAYLVKHGYTDVTNLEGGIDAWSKEVDPSVPLY